MMSNSIKFGFPDDKKGNILIALGKDQEEKMVSITYSDDGVGLPENIDLKNSSTIGMQLIFGLTRQLGGTIEIDQKNGFHATISLPSDTKSEENDIPE
jgi:two-component system, sensor histidine kinase PdtaS